MSRPERLPLFPLGTVLFPGLVLPLRIFEERYQRLVRDLLDGPEPRRFGVIAIREGRETGLGGVSSMYEIGCTAAVRRIVPHEDGRYELVTVGTERFRLAGLDDSLPYLRGDVEFLAEPTGDEAAVAEEVPAVHAAFTGYLDALAERGTHVRVPDLPGEPVLLSYLVAATIVVDLPDRQALLAEPDALARLRAERGLLAREATMLRTFTSTPAPDLRYTPFSQN